MTARRLTVSADTSSIPQIASFIEKCLEEKGISGEIANACGLAVDELTTNIIFYAYPGSGGTIQISCEIDEEWIDLSIRDRGIPFNPLSVPEPDIFSDADERKIGGLGIHLVRCIMDDVMYSRQGDENILMLRKRRF
jgi:serine/threonine-protein kinase RsbW